MAKRKIESNDRPPEELTEDRIKNLSLEQQIAVTQNIVNRSKMDAISAAHPPEFPSKLAAFVHRNFLASLAVGAAWAGYTILHGFEKGKPFLGLPFLGLPSLPAGYRGTRASPGISFLLGELILVISYFGYFNLVGSRSRSTGKLTTPSHIRLAGRLLAGWLGLMGMYYSIRYWNFSALEGILAFYIWGSYLAYGIFGRRKTLDLEQNGNHDQGLLRRQ